MQIDLRLCIVCFSFTSHLTVGFGGKSSEVIHAHFMLADFLHLRPPSAVRNVRFRSSLSKVDISKHLAAASESARETEILRGTNSILAIPLTHEP